MFWDTHMHSSFSGDSIASPESMAKAALSRGLCGICFTDHLDYDYPNDPDLFLLDLDTYCRSIQNLAQQYEGRLAICFGIELGMQPHLAQTHHQLLQDYDFDFVIASSHVVHQKDPYYDSYFYGRSLEDAYEEYFASILENIQVFHDFDVYGHLDYVIRYGMKTTAASRQEHHGCFYQNTKLRALIDEILKQLIALGKGIELNTAGFKYGLGHPNPCEDILKRYRELGGEILTLGADGHAPEQIAYCYHKLPDLLTACGFTYYTVFRQRKPVFVPVHSS